jgi:hypothetical protein
VETLGGRCFYQLESFHCLADLQRLAQKGPRSIWIRNGSCPYEYREEIHQILQTMIPYH